MRTFSGSSLIVATLAVLGCSGDDPNARSQQDSGRQTNSVSDPESRPSDSEPIQPDFEPKQPDTEPKRSDSETKQSGAEPKEPVQIEERLRHHALPAIQITPSKLPPKTPWQSRFGGVPYWPKAAPLPTAPDGNPLFLLAQINFSEAPHIPGYPAEGILQVFIADNDLYGLEFRGEERTQEQINKHPHGHKVIYHLNPVQDASKLLTEAPSPDSFPVTGSYSLTFKQVQDPVGVRDCRFDELIGRREELPEEMLDKLGEDFSGSGSKIAGYAFFTQYDPRAEVDAPGWILLLQIDTEYAEGISIKWGDSGVGNLFIKPEDLEKKDFSNVWYNWDCY